MSNEVVHTVRRGKVLEITIDNPPANAIEIDALASDVVNGPLVRRLMGFEDEDTKERLSR